MDDLLDRLLSLPEGEPRHALLRESALLMSNGESQEFSDALRDRAKDLARREVRRCMEAVDLFYTFADVRDDRKALARGHRFEAFVVMSAEGDNDGAIRLYDAALDIHRDLEDELACARVKGARMFALFGVGRVEDAVNDGTDAVRTLALAREHVDQGSVLINLANLLQHHGHLERALATAEEALVVLGDARKSQYLIPGALLTRGIMLIEMGRPTEAIEAIRSGADQAEQLGQDSILAMTKCHLGRAFFSRGEYGRALVYFEDAHSRFKAHAASLHVATTLLPMADCLLRLRRFDSAITMFRLAREGLSPESQPLQNGQSWLHEGIALMEVSCRDEALRAFEFARERFDTAKNPVWASMATLHSARALSADESPDEALSIAIGCAERVKEAGGAFEAAQAWLMVAHTALELGDDARAGESAAKALEYAEDHGVAEIEYIALSILATIAHHSGTTAHALSICERAIERLEHVQSRMIPHHRSSYVTDKQSPYDLAVQLRLNAGDVEEALLLVERSKAQALLERFSSIGATTIPERNGSDHRLVTELNSLRLERDEIASRKRLSDLEESQNPQAESLEDLNLIESKISDVWGRLLNTDTSYERDAAIWRVQAELPGPYLEDGTVLIEYFMFGEEIVVFVVDRDTTEAFSLGPRKGSVRRLLRTLGSNIRSAARVDAKHRVKLTESAVKVLGDLHAILLEPITKSLVDRRLIIVPHGELHYVPFHALHDGDQYVIQRQELSYLPGASFLRFVTQDSDSTAQPALKHMLCIGHDGGGRLSHSIGEATSLASRWDALLLAGEGATRDAVLDRLPHSDIIHVATHGQLRRDNPLFSALTLEGGDLSTLDILQTPLRASLVTLSACDTGRGIIGGGDEIEGLARSFMSAGARSIVGSLWSVEDAATAQLMDRFYDSLWKGATKGQALRQAQLSMIESSSESDDEGNGTAHPFYWAPFHLVGAAGPL